MAPAHNDDGSGQPGRVQRCWMLIVTRQRKTLLPVGARVTAILREPVGGQYDRREILDLNPHYWHSRQAVFGQVAEIGLTIPVSQDRPRDD